jgi:hypothetical protein
MNKNIAAALDRISTALIRIGEATIKGDLPGHPFRGNQWEGGQGVAREIAETKLKSDDFFERFQAEAVLQYLDGEPPLASYSDGKYRCVIMGMDVSNPDSPYDPKGKGIELTFKEGDPTPVPTGSWMDWHESHWKVSEQQYQRLPVAQRAALEAREQVEKWIPEQYERKRRQWYE